MTDKAAPRLFQSLRQLFAGLADMGRTRLALLANEVEEEEIRFRGVLTRVILALASFIVGAVLLAVFLALLFWENRLFVLGVACALCFAAALGFAWQSRAGLRQGSRLFKASLAELEADAARLRAAAQDEPPPA
jgi:uncharacterized membrane protein YqjE